MDVEWANWNDQWENWGPVECNDSWATDMQCVGGLQVCYCPTGATFLASGYYPAGTVCHQANLAQAWLESTSKATQSLGRGPEVLTMREWMPGSGAPSFWPRSPVRKARLVGLPPSSSKGLRRTKRRHGRERTRECKPLKTSCPLLRPLLRRKARSKPLTLLLEAVEDPRSATGDAVKLKV